MENKISDTYIHPFRVHTPNLLSETFVNACRPRDLAALRIPLNEFMKYLRTLTERCAELNDPVLNKIMIDMTLYEQSDLSSKEFSQEMVDQVNSNYKEFLSNQNLKP